MIYETGTPKGRLVIGTDGKNWSLDKGRKGIVGIVKLGHYISHHYQYNEDEYIGWFQLAKKTIHDDMKALVSFSKLDHAWIKEFNHHFSPRINGG